MGCGPSSDSQSAQHEGRKTDAELAEGLPEHLPDPNPAVTPTCGEGLHGSQHRLGVVVSIVPTAKSPLGRRLLSEDSFDAPTPCSVASTRKYSDSAMGSPQGPSVDLPEPATDAAPPLPVLHSRLCSPDDTRRLAASSTDSKPIAPEDQSSLLRSPPPPPDPFATTASDGSIIAVVAPLPPLEPSVPSRSKREVLDALLRDWPVVGHIGGTAATPIGTLQAEAKEDRQYDLTQRLFRELDLENRGALPFTRLHEGLLIRCQYAAVGDELLSSAETLMTPTRLLQSAVRAVKDFWRGHALPVTTTAKAPVSDFGQDEAPVVEPCDLRLVFLYLRTWLSLFVVFEQMSPSVEHLNQEDFHRMVRILQQWGIADELDPPGSALRGDIAEAGNNHKVDVVGSFKDQRDPQQPGPGPGKAATSIPPVHSFDQLRDGSGLVRFETFADWACRMELPRRYDPRDETMV